MRKTILALALCAALALTACAATMVKPINSGSKYAPKNEGDNGAGEVVYLQEGANSVISARREDAYQQMYGQCNGKYNIVKEWTDSESESGGLGEATANRSQAQGLSFFSSEQRHYRHITFKCVR